MVTRKSLDEYQLIAALLSDMQMSHSEVFTQRSLRLTTLKVAKRSEREGSGFFTKTLPRLGKALDRALLGDVPLNAKPLPFSRMKNSELPKFLGEFFKRVFSHDGWILPDPCVISIKLLRQFFACFYKYELPCSLKLEQKVLDQFEKTEQEILPYHDTLQSLADAIVNNGIDSLSGQTPVVRSIIRRARITLQRLFSTFDHKEIFPRHGPGAVSTKEQLEGKYTWTKISPRILQRYDVQCRE
jgi:hypothetical protein